MISRDDFIFTVGFEGNTAIVDASVKKANRRLDTRGLAGKGLYKAAVASAMYAGSVSELEEVLSIYNEKNERPLDSIEALKRTFGVLETFESIDRVMYV